MTPVRLIVPALMLIVLAVQPVSAQWAAPEKPLFPQGNGWVPIPGAAVSPDKSRTYRALYDAVQAARDPKGLVPAVAAMTGMYNAFAVNDVPTANARFALIFHGPAVDGLLDDAHYRAKHGVANPNLPILAQLRQLGVQILVCGQNLAAEKIDPKTLTTDVTVASSASVVLLTYQNDGYAVLRF